MAHRHRVTRPLSSALDREVRQVVRKILDESTQDDDSAPSQISLAQIYDVIKSSNTSLNRRPKKLLEDSIERVLDTIQSDENDDNAAEGEIDEALDTPASSRDDQIKSSSSGLNKSIVGAWSTKPGGPSRSQTATPNPSKRDRQMNGEPTAKRRKTERSVIDKAPPTHITFADMGGIEAIAEQVLKLLILPMKHPQYLRDGNLKTTRGILLHGPPGCGKTMFANALAAQLKVNFISIAAPSIVSGMSGESEKALREHFDEAKSCAPCLMFIDEIDAITPKRESAQREMEKRIVAQLLTCLDDLDPSKNEGRPVVVLAATNRPDSLDPALRRGGRFDKEIIMPVPTEAVREQILRALTRDCKLSDDVDFALLGRKTPGCVGADLNDLVLTASNISQERYIEALKQAAAAHAQDAAQSQSQAQPQQDNTTMDLDPPNLASTSTQTPPWLIPWTNIISYLETNASSAAALPTSLTTPTTITMADFLTALPKIQPSALREGFATIPSTSFSDVGALQSHISTLRHTLINPILNPSLYASFNVRSTAGILLWGPPGNGKTLLAKAVANASHANFISVKGPELLNKYVGESERSVRQLFTRARSSVPVIIFFDELDALVPRRDGGNSEASSRVVNTILTELDGVGASREGIYIIAATNRPDIIDPAMLRPGRLETLLYVGLPGPEDRVEILKTLTKKLKGFVWSEEVALLARGCERFSGADLENLVRQAAFVAIQRLMQVNGGSHVNADQGVVLLDDFVDARQRVKPSVSEEEHARFRALQEELGQ